MDICRSVNTPSLRILPTLLFPLALLFSVEAHAGTHVMEAAAGLDAAFTGSGLYLLGDLSDPSQRTPASLMSGPPKYGIFMVRYQYRGIAGRKVAAGVEVNTDTLSGDVWAWDVGVPGLGMGVFGRAEALLAGVNINHMRDGRNQTDRGFGASYAMGGARVSYTVLRYLTVEAEGAARAWVFNPMPGTDRAFRVPAPYVSAEPRVRFKWLGASNRRSQFGLTHGLAAVLEVAADLRALNKPWGGKRGSEPVDPRNNLAMGTVARRASAFISGGGRPLKGLYLGGLLQGGYGDGEDDITRTRVGGMNPYVVQMPGAAWGEFLCDRYVAATVTAGVVANPYLYVGGTLNGAVVNDPRRVGALDEPGVVRGASAEVRAAVLDLLLVRAQVGGNIDVTRPATRGAMGVFLWLEMGLWL